MESPSHVVGDVGQWDPSGEFWILRRIEVFWTTCVGQDVYRHCAYITTTASWRVEHDPDEQ